jgi:hypothetical protein
MNPTEVFFHTALLGKTITGCAKGNYLVSPHSEDEASCLILYFSDNTQVFVTAKGTTFHWGENVCTDLEFSQHVAEKDLLFDGLKIETALHL